MLQSQVVAENMNAMHRARQEFMHAESLGSLKRALKSKIYPRGDNIQEKDWIDYKKDNGKSTGRIWRGPSLVVAINGKKLFVDQGARLGTVNRDDAIRVEDEFWTMEDVEKEYRK